MIEAVRGADRAGEGAEVERGSAKINISTNLKHVFVDSFVKYHEAKPKDYEPLRLIDAQYRACKALFAGFIARFGGENRAEPFLASCKEAA